MNCTQANKISINDFLTSLGFKGRSNGKNYTMYSAPYRKDEKPSFCVFSDSNKWFDHSTQESGDLIRLVQKMHSCNISQALQIIANKTPIQASNSFFLNKQKKLLRPVKNNRFNNVKLSAVKDRYLIEYLEKRKITREVWENQKNLFQMEYTTLNKSGKLIKAKNLAWESDSKSYELRGTTDFKTTFGNKDITTINGDETGLNIFEGFFSYMSALVFYKSNKLKYTTIVLNSISNIKKTYQAISKAEIVNLFLDNDKAGIRASNTLQSLANNSINRSQEIYPNYKDFNDLLNEKSIN